MAKGRIKTNIISFLIISIIAVVSFSMVKSGINSVKAERREFQESSFLGQHYIINDDFAKAENYFNEAIEIKDNSEDAKIGLVSAYILQKKYQHAEKLVLEVIDEHSKSAEAHKLLGLIRMSQKDLEGAREEFNKAKSLHKKKKEEYDDLILRTEYLLKNEDTLTSVDINNEIARNIIQDMEQRQTSFTEKLGDDGKAYEVLANAQTNFQNNESHEVVKRIEVLDEELKQHPVVLKTLGKAQMLSNNVNEAQNILRAAYDKVEDEETAVLLSEIYLYQLKYGINYDEDTQELHEEIGLINNEINDINNEISSLNAEEDKKKIEKLTEERDELQEDINEKNYKYINSQIKKIVRNHKNSLELLEKQAKLNFIAGYKEDAEEYIFDLLDEAEGSRDKSIKTIANNIRANQEMGGKGNSMEQFINLNTKFFNTINKYSPRNWLNSEYNRQWQNYFTTYFAYNNANIHILDINTEMFPTIVTTFRVNGNNDKRFSKKYFEITDSGQEVDNFEILKRNQSETNVVLLMDTSGSMKDQRIEQAKRASNSFVENMGKNEKVMFAAFSGKCNPLTEFLDYEEKETLINSINSVHANGGTNIYGSIDQCLSILEKRKGRKIIVIMTDGEDGNEGALPEVAARANNLGIPIFSIGLDVGYKTLQRISFETGGQFFAASNENQLSNMYNLIREQLDTDYVIKYSVKDIEKSKRHVKVKLKKDDVMGRKRYSVGNGAGNNENYDNNYNAYVMSSDIVSPSLIYKSAENTDIQVVVDLSKEKILGEITDVYIDNIRIKNEEWQLNEGKITINVPEFLNVGKYNLLLEDNIGETYIIKNSLMIKDFGIAGTFNVGNIKLYGEVPEGRNTGTEMIIGDYSLNDIINVSGEMNIDRDNNSIHGLGYITMDVEGKQVTLHNGQFDIDCEKQIINFNGNNQGVIGKIKLQLEQIKLAGDKVEGSGYVNLRIKESQRRILRERLPLEHCIITKDAIELKAKNFSINSNIFKLNDGQLELKNGRWKGQGRISCNDGINDYSYRGYENDSVDFELIFEDAENLFLIKEIDIKVNKENSINLAKTGMKFTPKTIKILDPLSNMIRTEYTGNAAYEMGVGKKLLSGTIQVNQGASNLAKIKGTLKNEYINISLDDIFNEKSEFYGKAVIDIDNTELGKVHGEGNITLSQEGLYGSLTGKIKDFDNESFEISNELLVAVDKNGQKFEYAFNGEVDNLSNLKVLADETGIEEINVQPNEKELIIQIKWDNEDTDFKLLSQDGKEYTPENAKDNNSQYVKRDKKAYYIIKNPSEGTWKLELTNKDVGVFRVGIYRKNEPPMIKLTDIISDVRNIQLKWELENIEDNPEIRVYYYDNTTQEKKILHKGIKANWSEKGVTLSSPKIEPGDYQIFVSIYDGKNVPTYSFYEKPVTIFEQSLPAKLSIKNSYKINDKIVIEPKIDNTNNRNLIRIYEVDDNGKINAVNYIEQNINDHIVIRNSSAKKFRIAACDYNKNEGPLSEIIDADKLPAGNSGVTVEWNPNESHINKSRIEGVLKIIQNTVANFKVNGDYTLKDVSVSGTYPLDMEEGYNEIIIYSRDEGNYNSYDEIIKDYIVDSKPPLLNMDKEYGVDLPKKKDMVISGRTEVGAVVDINGEKVDIDNAGNFLKEVKLKFGKNPINITVEDNSGNITKYDTTIEYYGNLKLIILGGFAALYAITILVFVILYKRKKKRVKLGA